jgi:hypothetical protein
MLLAHFWKDRPRGRRPPVRAIAHPAHGRGRRRSRLRPRQLRLRRLSGGVRFDRACAVEDRRDAKRRQPAELRDQYHERLVHRPEVQNVRVSAQYSSANGSKLVVDGSAIIPTVFLHVLGYDHTTIGAASGNTRLRVALVLDNTWRRTAR